MNREQLIEKAASAIRKHLPTVRPIVLTAMGTTIVDAVLPQITTVEELEALPSGAKVLDASGEVWRVVRWPYQTLFYSTVATLGVHEAAEIVARGPLTIVWQP